MEKAFAYLRVSGKGQVEGDGFPRQLAAIKKYAATHDIKIVNVFEEKGVSGAKDLEDRPALIELMAALHSNSVKLVLVEKLDRLARDLMVQETIIADVQKRGFRLISVAEPDLLQDDPSRKLMRQIFGGIAEYEKTMIVLKLRGARERAKQQNGRCEGRKPFGHRAGESAALDRIAALRREQWGFDRIAAQLNTEGLQTRSGAPWYGKVVNSIVMRDPHLRELVKERRARTTCPALPA
jgi:DNA invertase Pin-like site-specific DNA recombinase